MAVMADGKESYVSLEEIQQKFLRKNHASDPEAWLREKRKRLRVAGKEYINSKGVLVTAKNIGADCKCRRKCYEIIPEERRKKLFVNFYNLKSHSEQNAYLYPFIKKSEIARKRNVASDRRSCTFKYFVKVKEDSLEREVQVCREAFANIYGISVHKVRVLCSKMEQNIASPRDERGRHKNRPNKLNPENIELVKQHIQSIVESENIKKFKQESGRHSAIGLNITKMWEDFCSNHKKLPNPDSATTTYEPVVKLWVYYRFFNELVKSKYEGISSYKERDSNTQERKGKDKIKEGNLQYVVKEVPSELQTQPNNYLLHEHNAFDVPLPALPAHSYTVLDCSEMGAGTELVLISDAI